MEFDLLNLLWPGKDGHWTQRGEEKGDKIS